MKSKRDIRSLLEKQGQTQRQFAQALAIHESTVSKIIKGTRKPSIRLALAFSRALGIPVEELFE